MNLFLGVLAEPEGSAVSMSDSVASPWLYWYVSISLVVIAIISMVPPEKLDNWRHLVVLGGIVGSCVMFPGSAYFILSRLIGSLFPSASPPKTSPSTSPHRHLLELQAQGPPLKTTHITYRDLFAQKPQAALELCPLVDAPPLPYVQKALPAHVDPHPLQAQDRYVRLLQQQAHCNLKGPWPHDFVLKYRVNVKIYNTNDVSAAIMEKLKENHHIPEANLACRAEAPFGYRRIPMADPKFSDWQIMNPRLELPENCPYPLCSCFCRIAFVMSYLYYCACFCIT